jgi:hypothetical protein
LRGRTEPAPAFAIYSLHGRGPAQGTSPLPARRPRALSARGLRDAARGAALRADLWEVLREPEPFGCAPGGRLRLCPSPLWNRVGGGRQGPRRSHGRGAGGSLRGPAGRPLYLTLQESHPQGADRGSSGPRRRGPLPRHLAAGPRRQARSLRGIERQIELLVNEGGRFVVALPEGGVYRSRALPEIHLDLAVFWKKVEEDLE